MSMPSTPVSPPDRLERLGRSAARRKPEGGPKALTARHKLLISYMIDGVQHRPLLARITRPTAVIEDGAPVIRDLPPEPGQPLTLIEAADLLRIRRRNARELMTLPIFQHAYNAELTRYREGERAASLRTLVEVRDDEGTGKAADRKVRLQAAQALLGEGDQGTKVTVNVNAQRITAGVVIRMPPRERFELGDDAKLVEHQTKGSQDAC